MNMSLLFWSASTEPKTVFVCIRKGLIDHIRSPAFWYKPLEEMEDGSAGGTACRSRARSVSMHPVSNHEYLTIDSNHHHMHWNAQFLGKPQSACIIFMWQTTLRVADNSSSGRQLFEWQTTLRWTRSSCLMPVVAWHQTIPWHISFRFLVCTSSFISHECTTPCLFLTSCEAKSEVLTFRSVGQEELQVFT